VVKQWGRETDRSLLSSGDVNNDGVTPLRGVMLN
jgi:hypothetical protein